MYNKFKKNKMFVLLLLINFVVDFIYVIF